MMNLLLKYTVILEKGASSYGAYVPELTGCVAVDETREEALQLIQEAISFHLEDLQERGHLIPELTSTSKNVTLTMANSNV